MQLHHGELAVVGLFLRLRGGFMNEWREQLDNCDWCSKTRIVVPGTAEVASHLRDAHAGFLEFLRDMLTLDAAVERGLVQGG